MPYRVALYSPDRGQIYDGRTLDATGVGGGITARLSMVSALAAIGHDVTAYVNCESPITHAGVRYVPLDQAGAIDTDILIAISTGGELSFAPIRGLNVRASLRIVWVQGVPKPADLDAVSPDYVYAASNFLRRVCGERWGIPASKLFVCYNGLNQAAFQAAAARPVARDPYALAYIGPPEKGLDASLEVLRRLRARDDRFHLDVFGGGRLWGRSDEAPEAEPGLAFRGMLGQAALVPELFRYEYLLAPQAMEEGFGIAVQEAKRAGMVVIASDVGAFSELIRSSQDGYLVAEPHDSAACHDRMAALIRGLSFDPARRARIRANAMQTPWSWDTAARTWTAHWDHVLRRPAAGAAVLNLPDGLHDTATGEYMPDAPQESNRILVAGYYGHGNLGDEAILHVMLEELRRRLPNVAVTVASGNPEATRATYDVAAVHERDVPALVDGVRDSDLVVVGGGGLFHDYQGVDEATVLSRWHWGLTYFAAFPLLATLFRKPLLLSALGVGPLLSDAGRRYTRLTFDRADAASVRDPASHALLADIGVDVSRVRLAADPAFLLRAPSSDEGRVALARIGVPPGVPVVVVAVRHWDEGVRPEIWQSHVAAALDRFVESHNAVPVFVPFQSRAEHGLSDDAVAGRIRSEMRHGARAVMAEADLGPCEVQALVAGADLVLAVRLHAVILAGTAGVPVVALAYDRKVAAAMTELGMGEYSLGLDEPAAAIGDGLDRAYRTREDARRLMLAAMRDLRAGADANAALAIDLLAARAQPPRPAPPELVELLRDAYTSQIQRAEVNEAHVVRLTADLAAEARELSVAAEAHGRDRAALAGELEARTRELAARTADLDARTAVLDARTAELEVRTTELDATRAAAAVAASDRDRVSAALATATARLLDLARAQDPASVPPQAPATAGPDQAAALADVTRRFAEVSREAASLQDQLSRAVNTRSWRVMNWYWQRRAALRDLMRNPARLPHRVARATYHALVPLGARQAVRRRTARLRMNPYEYVFDRYKRERAAAYGADLAGLTAPGESGLVSVILPAFNGAAMIAEAIDSVLTQTHARLELIIINDGSTDDTRAIADAYAGRDPRVRVVHQENQKLPRALSEGVRHARGEFITWTSCDNRLKPDCLERMVADLRRRPGVDMVYANLDIIGEDGRALRGAKEYDGYQRPPGSQHVHLPETTAELNVWANNSIGAAFLYRRRVAMLLGDYSRFRFVSEDYDYWMRVNALLTLRHAGFDETVYDYRFHGASLTARWEELGMLRHRERLMVFEEFRRDFCLSPLVWVIDGDAPDVVEALERRVRAAGHVLFRRQFPLAQLPALWVPVVHVRTAASPQSAGDPRTDLPASAISVVVARSGVLPNKMLDGWDLCIEIGGTGDLPALPRPRQGWLRAADIGTAFHAIDIRARSEHLARLEALIEAPPTTALKASVVICTHRFNDRVVAAIRSALEQTAAPDTYEVLVVNNAPAKPDLTQAVQKLRDTHRRDRPDHLRLVACPILGLSAARNAGIAEARGELICLLDDDAIADPNWLARLYEAFDAHPETGVIGGHIHLKIPEPRPPALKPGWEKYWSQFVTGHTGYAEVQYWWEFPWGANWSARRAALLAIGGFRVRYGRVGDNFWGGEEVIAASLIQRVGYRIAILPDASVLHDVDPARFSAAHVRRTLVAGHCVAYLGQRDLYIPMESGLKTTFKLLAGTYVDTTVPGRRDRSLDMMFRKYAQVRLLMLQLSDLRRRFRRPLVASDPPGRVRADAAGEGG